MSTRNFSKRPSARALAVVLSIQVAFLPASFALRVQISSNVKLRSVEDKSMERVGLLKKGSIVEIPDRFTVERNGKPDLELTLNNWLRMAGENRSGRKSDGAGTYAFDGERSELFFPVTIVKPAKGSTVRTSHQDSEKFIALKYLIRSGNAMIVSDDAIVSDAKESNGYTGRENGDTTKDEQATSQMEAQSICATGLCARPSDASTQVRDLIDAISPGLAATNGASEHLRARTTTDLKLVYKTFQSSCGFSLSEFIPTVKAQAGAAGVPPELLLSIMTQENSGRCYLTNSESNSTQSLGIFQVNSTNRNYPRCSTDQITQLRTIGSLTGLSTGPRCLENPLVNLSEAIRLLRGKRESLANGGFDLSKLEAGNQWRLVAASYNGGQRWALQAKNDLEAFNKIHGTSLSAYNWGDLRIFFMREYLNRAEKNGAFGDAKEGRSRENSVSNLAYSENIAGRPVTDSNRSSLMTTWRSVLNQ